MKLNTTKHMMSETNVQNLKKSDAEVAFVGRSNAGKSSLINALCQKKNMAHVSQVPGKTRTINVYEVKPYRFIVDLPGYGYAVGSAAGDANFGPMIEGYLTKRDNCLMVFVVLEIVAAPTKLDLSMINWLIHQRLPFTIVINKIDKIASTKFESRQKEIADKIGISVKEMFWVSSKNKVQIEPLQKLIVDLLLE